MLELSIINMLEKELVTENDFYEFEQAILREVIWTSADIDAEVQITTNKKIDEIYWDSFKYLSGEVDMETIVMEIMCYNWALIRSLVEKYYDSGNYYLPDYIELIAEQCYGDRDAIIEELTEGEMECYNHDMFSDAENYLEALFIKRGYGFEYSGCHDLCSVFDDLIAQSTDIIFDSQNLLFEEWYKSDMKPFEDYCFDSSLVRIMPGKVKG